MSAFLGSLPSGWKYTKLKKVVQSTRPITYGIVQAGPMIDDGVPYVRPADMTDERGVVDLGSVLRTSHEIAAAYRRSTVQTNDLVCTIGPSFGKVMVVPEELSGANLTQGTARVAIEARHSARYYFWVLRSTASYAQWESSVGGATFGALNLAPLAETIVPEPPHAEQVAVAAFLDRETRKIDALAEEQRRLLELLKEKRQTAISQAVTKGLDPNIKMRASGVEWLGNVPEHWDVRRLGTIFSEIAEPGDGDLPIFSVSIHHGVSDKELDDDDLDRKVSRSEDRSKYKRVQPLDLVYNMMRAWQGGFGSVQAVGMVSPAYVVARPKTALSTIYIEALLRTSKAVEEMRRRSRGITDFRLRLYWDEFKDMSVALPPLEEQNDIVRAVTAADARTKALMSESSVLISLLQERRSALISAAVTGKIDVRAPVADQVHAA